MRIIIEEHKYAAAYVKDVLKGVDALENFEGYVSMNYVGYFYNTDKDVRDCVFILPKVLLEDVDGKELVFGKYAPEEIMNLDAHNPLTQPEKDFIKTHFQQLLGKIYTPFSQDKSIYSLALENADKYKSENEALLSELRKHFFVEPCALGRDPLEVLPEITASCGGIMPADAAEKNVLTCLVRKTDDNFKSYYEHNGKSYTMERIPTINLMGIKYLLPMVGGMIDGYYEIERMAFVDNKGEPRLRLRLGEYHHIGEKWVHICRTKMQPGELISLDYTMKMYNE